jgi:hypothetical protein
MRIPSPMGSGTELQQSDGWNLERLELCAFAHGRKDKAKAAEERGERIRRRQLRSVAKGLGEGS